MRHTPRRLFADQSAIASLEFAILLPMLCTFLLGLYDLYSYMRAVNLVELTAISLSNLIAQRSTPVVDCALTTDSSYLGSYFNAAEQIAQPLTLSSKGMIILTAVDNAGVGPVVAWQRHTSYTLSGVSSSIGQQNGAATLPNNMTVLADDNDTVVVAEVFYKFDPFTSLRALTSMMPTVPTISRTFYFRSRFGGINTLGAANGCTGLPT